MGHREAFATVSLAWLLAALLGALPYVFLGLSPVDAIFESMSGFTTAEATILSEYNSQGYGILNNDLAQSSLAYALSDRAVSYLLHCSSALTICL